MTIVPPNQVTQANRRAITRLTFLLYALSAALGGETLSPAADSTPADQVALHEEAVATFQPCINNLKEISLAFGFWAAGHNKKLPFNVSTNDGGTMELCTRETGQFDQSAFLIFKRMSNALANPKILVCPADWLAKPAIDFQNLQRTNVSYLLRTGSNVTFDHPEQILAFCPIHEHIICADGHVVTGPTPGPAYTLPSASQLRAAFSSQAENSARSACIINLRVISGAKAAWALVEHKADSDVPRTSDLLTFIGSPNRFPVCPAGGVYSIRRGDQSPMCSIPGHSLDERH